ncbi:MAG: HD domain-containing protein [Candidatus Hydrogenedentes bacterium]|nr:HD domain-containing protein [Candidatus Hydrogenedentota bacterium]MBI3118773.1 HD domain-containing protein [Candidatus Hydrogenedentota bacterium]
MKNQFVSSLQEGDFVNDYFVAVRKDLRFRQTGGPFLGMVFKDRTGDMGGIMWNNAADVAKLFELGDVVNVRGRVSTYQNRLQIQVEQVLPLRETEYRLEDLILTASDPKEDLARLRALLDTVKNTWLQQLLQLFWQDTAFMQQFIAAVAAKKWHHEYRGGLARHCYEMARLAETMCELYPELDRDVLLTSVFLHDLGKLQEMTHDLAVDYTNEGKLLGHLQIGCDLAQVKMCQIPNFPNNLRLELLHCILSHHGELLNGSPVVPKTLEAIVLHHIDNLDAQAAAFSRIIRETREKKQEWSEFLPLIDRVIWTKGV